jgi:hypothetical protein
MENKFVDGLFAKPPHERAPDFVKGRLSIKPAQFMDWLNQHVGKEWLNLDIKVSKDGKWYCAVNDYDPKAQDPLAPARQALSAVGLEQSEETQNPYRLEDIPFN